MINRAKIQKLHALTREVQKADATASELLRTAQDRHNHTEEEVERDGKKVKVTRKLLWDEVFYLGTKCDAAEILKGYHPEVFEAYEAQAKAADALRTFTLTELDVDYTKMRLSDYVRITEELFNMFFEERMEAKDGNTPSPIQKS